MTGEKESEINSPVIAQWKACKYL
ncbi:hypothetical protein EMIT0158MI4_290021 [Burkholderia ambifaria]